MPSKIQKTWEERLRLAKEKKDEWMTKFKVELARQYWEGFQNNYGYAEAEWITVNRIYSHLQAQLPMLYSMDPYFYVKLKKSFDSLTDEDVQAWTQSGNIPPAIVAMEKKSKGRQAMLNYLKVELGFKSKIRLAILDAHFAFGVCIDRRASDMQKHPHAGEPILDDNGNPVKDEATGQTMLYPEKKPVNERYEMDRVHPDDIFFDADAGPLEDSWKAIFQRLVMTKKEAMDDPRFNSKVVANIKGTRRKSQKESEKRSGLVGVLRDAYGKPDPEEEYLEIYAAYDIVKREFLFLCEGAEDVLMKSRSLPLGIEKHPFSFLRFTLRDNSPYPLPPVFNAMDPQREVSLSRSHRMTHRKRFNRKYVLNTTAFEHPEEALSKLESGSDGTVLEARMNADAAVQPIQDAPLDQQQILEMQALDNDIVEALGSPGNARGVANADSATEADILDKRLEVREGDKLSIVVDFIIDIARKLDMLVQAHIDKDEAVRIIGPEGEAWQLIRTTDYDKINGEYEYSVNVGASQPRLPHLERAQFTAFMSQVVIPFPHILTKPNTMKRIAEMFHIEDETMVEELRQLGLAIMSGAMPMPGGQGGGPSDNPVASLMGAAGGFGGGTMNGGGAPTLMQ